MKNVKKTKNVNNVKSKKWIRVEVWQLKDLISISLRFVKIFRKTYIFYQKDCPIEWQST